MHCMKTNQINATLMLEVYRFRDQLQSPDSTSAKLWMLKNEK